MSLRAELLQAFQFVVAQFVASLEEILHLAGDALLLRHHRHRLALRRRLIDALEDAANVLNADAVGIAGGTDDARLYRQGRLAAVLCQQRQFAVHLHVLVVRLRLIVLAGLAAAGIEVGPLLFAVFRVGGARSPSLPVGLGIGIVGQRRVILVDDGQRLGIGVIVEVAVLAHPAPAMERLLFQANLAVAEGTIVLRGLLLGVLQELLVAGSILWQLPVFRLTAHHDLQAPAADTAEHEYRLRQLDGALSYLLHLRDVQVVADGKQHQP